MLCGDDFIHLSKTEQVHLPANAIYSDTSGLVLLWFDPTPVTAEIRYEHAEPGSHQLDPRKPGRLELPAPPLA